MSVTVTQQLTQQTVTVTGNPVESNVTVTVSNALGAAGLNAITTLTTAPSLTGYIFGNGTTIAGATAATNDATASTLARRDSTGGCQFTDLSATVSFDAGTFSVDSLTGSTFEAGSSVTFNATAYTYGTGAASAHRTALGSGATGDALFTAANAAAARTTLGLATTDTVTVLQLNAAVLQTTGNGIFAGETPIRLGTSNAMYFRALASSDVVSLTTSAGGTNYRDLMLRNLTASGFVATTPATRSGPGALSVTASSIALTTTGVADALTLANGTNGQILTVCHVSRGGGTGTAVLTPTTKNGYTTITFTATGDSATLQYHTTGGWHIIGSHGVTIA